MKALADEKRAELRRDYGPDLKVIELEGHEDLALVVRPPTWKMWAAAFDQIGKPTQRFDGLHNLLLDCAVWPSPQELVPLLDYLPALPEVVWPVLYEMAGAPEDALERIEIARLSAEDRATLVSSGLPETRLDEIIAAHPRRGQIAALRMPNGIWILKRSRAAYAGFRKLTAEGKFSEGLRKMALNSVLWPGEEVVAALSERSPGLVTAVGEACYEINGEGARARVGGI